VSAVLRAAESLRYLVLIIIEIDVGLHRCGLSEAQYDSALLPMLRDVLDSPYAEFSGICSHAGQAYSSSSADDAQAVAEQERNLMLNWRERILRDFPALSRSSFAISIGATPTECARVNYEGITEARPGNYVFMDLTCLRMGLIDISRISLTVAARIISENDRYWIVDAGSKVLSSDQRPHASGGGGGYGIALRSRDFCQLMDTSLNPTSSSSSFSSSPPLPPPPSSSSPPPAPIGLDRLLAIGHVITKLSEEHGWIEKPVAASSNTADTEEPWQVGDIVRIFPNHSCPVANLANLLYVCSHSPADSPTSRRLYSCFPVYVSARGCVV